MTVPATVSAISRGPIPKSSAYGLGTLTMLPGAVFFFIMQSLVPVLRNGLDIWLDSILPAIGVSVIAASIVACGLAGRRPWYIRFVFTFGWLVAAAYGFGLALGFAILLGLIPRTYPDLAFMSYVNIIDWLVISPLVWLLVRMLQQRYWQPGSTPDQWEPATDTGPPRTLLMTWANRKR